MQHSRNPHLWKGSRILLRLKQRLRLVASSPFNNLAIQLSRFVAWLCYRKKPTPKKQFKKSEILLASTLDAQNYLTVMSSDIVFRENASFSGFKS